MRFQNLLSCALPIAAFVLVTGCSDRVQDTNSQSSEQTPPPSATPSLPPPPPHKEVGLQLTTLDASTGQFGHEARRIVEALQRLDLKQGKFESDAQFLARMKSFGTEPLYDDLTVGSRLALRMSVVNWRYDANKARWVFTVNNHPMVMRQELYAITSRKIGNGETWTRAFPGRKIEEFETIALNAENAPSLDGNFPVTAEKAQHLDNKMDVLVIGRLAPPFVTTYQSLPVDNPNNTRVDTVHTLKLQMEEAWIVNRISGAVIQKTKLKRK